MAQDKTPPQPGGGPFCSLIDGARISPYGLYDTVSVTMTMEQWETVQQFLQFGENYHKTKMCEWTTTSCKDRKMCERNAAQNKAAAAEAESLRKIIEAAIYPIPPKETE